MLLITHDSVSGIRLSCGRSQNVGSLCNGTRLAFGVQQVPYRVTDDEYKIIVLRCMDAVTNTTTPGLVTPLARSAYSSSKRTCHQTQSVWPIATPLQPHTLPPTPTPPHRKFPSGLSTPPLALLTSLLLASASLSFLSRSLTCSRICKCIFRRTGTMVPSTNHLNTTLQ